MQCHSPTKGLEGRCCAVRFKQRKGNKRDICIVTMYWPVFKGANPNDYNTSVDLLIDWLCKFLQGLPQRCTPIVALDGNFKFGFNDGIPPPAGDAVGCNRPDQQTPAGVFSEQRAMHLISKFTIHITRMDLLQHHSAKSATRVHYMC